MARIKLDREQVKLILIALLGFIDEALIVALIVGLILYVLVRLQVISVRDAVIASIPFIVIGAIVLAKVIESMKRERKAGIETLVGLTGRVVSVEQGGVLYIELEGELWKAKSLGGNVKEGDYVVVRGYRGLTLLVEKTEPPKLLE